MDRYSIYRMIEMMLKHKIVAGLATDREAVIYCWYARGEIRDVEAGRALLGLAWIFDHMEREPYDMDDVSRLLDVSDAMEASYGHSHLFEEIGIKMLKDRPHLFTWPPGGDEARDDGRSELLPDGTQCLI
jgi:hypothetical protein